MARILAIDYGKKRTGIAVTDPMQIIASGLTTVETPKLFDFLKDYFQTEEVETVVIGFPFQFENTNMPHSVPLIEAFIKRFKKLFPDMPIVKEDEHFTSKMATQVMIDGGVKKMKRRDKALVDKISAAIILQSFMEHKNK